jgi:uncharacterized membrane protein YccF (DUF307 family)
MDVATLDDRVATLVAMGFTSAEAEAAIKTNGSDMERAVEQLVSRTPSALDRSSPYPASQQERTLPMHYNDNRNHSNSVQYVTFKQDRRGLCYWSLNILWIVLGGWHMFLAWFTTGLILCLTCVMFPCGWQVIKISFFLLFPFGLSLVDTDDEITDSDIRCCSKSCNCLLNILWAITVGWILALQSIITGILLCLTIIGIPFGIQCFKMAYLCFRPFGLGVTAEEVTVLQVVPTTNTTYLVPTNTEYRAL